MLEDSERAENDQGSFEGEGFSFSITNLMMLQFDFLKTVFIASIGKNEHKKRKLPKSVFKLRYYSICMLTS